tara:strand:- start:5883 stop:6086 length:204 start_codon:yes stop_codon:yes gene_type:complete
MKPLHAELSLVKSPFKLLSFSSAISFAEPPAFSKATVRLSNSCTFSAKTIKEPLALSPTNSLAIANF